MQNKEKQTTRETILPRFIINYNQPIIYQITAFSRVPVLIFMKTYLSENLHNGRYIWLFKDYL